MAGYENLGVDWGAITSRIAPAQITTAYQSAKPDYRTINAIINNARRMKYYADRINKPGYHQAYRRSLLAVKKLATRIY